MPTSTTIGGDAWGQSGATFDQTANGQTISLEALLLADLHTANSSTPTAFTILLTTTTQMFDQVNTDDFQPMLQSFMFTS